MRGIRGFTRLLIVTVSTLTLLLLAAVGAAAASGTLGSQKAVKSVITLVAPNALKSGESSQKDEANGGDNNGKHTGECHPPKKTHKHGTPGHKNHPCGEDGDDSD
jgi:hypothetical protein